MIMTMLKLSLALKLLNGKINQEQVKKRECIGFSTSLFFAFGYLTFVVYLFVIVQRGEKLGKWLWYALLVA